MHRRIDLSASVSVQDIKTTNILKHDTSFAACLFLVANGAWFVQKKLGFRIMISSVSKVIARDMDRVRNQGLGLALGLCIYHTVA